MKTYTAKECSCWCDYPNQAYKKINGQWKCIDCYKQVRKRNGHYRKTKCVLIEKGDAMTQHQRKLTEEDLKEIEEKGVYSQFTEAQILGCGVYDAHVVEIDGEKYLRFSMGD